MTTMIWINAGLLVLIETLHVWEQTSVKFQSKYDHFHERK